MDSLTHLVFGAALGEALLGKKAGKKAMLLGALVNSIPDLDVFLVLGDPIREITLHRGISHSFLFSVVAAPLLAWLANRYLKDRIGFRAWALFFFCLLVTHPILDCLTTYGTQFLLPFSDYRVNFNSLFIIDVVFTLPMLVAVVACLVMRVNNPNRVTWNRIGLGISVVYAVLGLSFKAVASQVFEESLAGKKIKTQHRMTGVTPFNILLWYTVAEVDSGYYVGYYSLLDKDKNIGYTFVNRKTSLLGDMRNEYAVDRLIWFSNGYYSVERVGDETRFFTLKFGPSGFDLKKPLSSSVPFFYILRRKADGSLSVENIRGFDKLDLARSLSELYHRVLGEKKRLGSVRK